MNQAEKQFVFDLQRFAEEAAPAPETADEAKPEAQGTTEAETQAPARNETPPETDGAEGSSAKEAPPDFSKLGAMTQDEQLAFLRKHGFTDEAPEEPEAPKAPETKTEDTQKDAGDHAEQAPAAPEQEFEVTVDGQKVKVKLSELLNGYQRQADYTRKTQALADERRQVDAMMAALKVREGTKSGESKADQPANQVQKDYDAAVAEAERRLGLKPGEFNQFDPQHNFALQQVSIERASARSTQAAVQKEVQEFVAQAQQDPMTKDIDDNFLVCLLRRGTESKEGAEKALAISGARERLMNNQATHADTELLKEHWEYTRQQLQKAKAPQQTAVQPPAPKPEPPKTETPGQTAAQSREPFRAEKLRTMNTKQQIAALRRAGFM